MFKKAYYIISYFFMLSLVIGCGENRMSPKKNKGGVDSLTYSVERAPQWSALFKRNAGWFGADGIFAIPLNGKEAPGSAKQSQTLFLFSDTMIGNPEADSVVAHSNMINNSAAILKGDKPLDKKLNFYWDKGKDGKPQALFIPQTKRSEEGDYYWLGDGFVNSSVESNMYIFAYRMQKTGGDWGFKEAGNVLIKLPAGSRPPFENQEQIDTPFFIPAKNGEGYCSFGAGILVNTKEAAVSNPDGFLYIYGVKNNSSSKELLVARVKPKDIEDFKRWTFWDGNGWNTNIDSVQSVTDRISNELSVYPVGKDKYALIFQVDGIGNEVGMRIGKSPHGPFGPLKKLWDASEATKMDKDFIAYNAKAHPNLSQPGELLISYNVNSFDFFKDLEEYPHLYRPRFIKLKFNN